MRTTLDVENDVLETARALAVARGVSVGKALSEMARRGFAARNPVKMRNGFAVFQVPPSAASFGEDDIEVALQKQDPDLAGQFIEPVR